MWGCMESSSPWEHTKETQGSSHFENNCRSKSYSVKKGVFIPQIELLWAHFTIATTASTTGCLFHPNLPHAGDLFPMAHILPGFPSALPGRRAGVNARLLGLLRGLRRRSHGKLLNTSQCSQIPLSPHLRAIMLSGGQRAEVSEGW